MHAMENSALNSTELISIFQEKGVFKHGQFTLKSGFLSPIYIDFRILISSPSILNLVAQVMIEIIQKNECIKFDYILGVPYAALPLATLVSAKLDIPMLLCRKEAKTYGTKKLLEGIYESGRKCLIIEDVISTGSSILESVEVLQREGLIVNDILVILDRQQGGANELKSKGYSLHSIINMDEILDHLISTKVLDANGKKEIVNKLRAKVKVTVDWSWKNRRNVCKNRIAKDLMDIIIKKKTNLCVAADYTSQQQILRLATLIGSEICMLKTHVDIIDDFEPEFAIKLSDIARRENFLIIEDRKLADTGNTVRLQVSHGVYKVSSWAHLVTVHSLPGPSVVQGLKTIINDGHGSLAGSLLVAELSTRSALTSLKDYVFCIDDIRLHPSIAIESAIPATVQIAHNHDTLVSGFICQRRCSDSPGFLYITPGMSTACKYHSTVPYISGVHLDEQSDDFNQQWRVPEKAIIDDQNDVVVVGRAITMASDPVDKAKEFRHRAWTALCQRDGLDS